MVGIAKRTTRAYTFWRMQVLKRDGFHCIVCGSQESLEAHHLKRWVDDVENRLLIENGISLCRICHDKVHEGNGRKPDPKYTVDLLNRLIVLYSKKADSKKLGKGTKRKYRMKVEKLRDSFDRVYVEALYKQKQEQLFIPKTILRKHKD